MNRTPATRSNIPRSLHPYFQEYDVKTLDIDRDANLIIQRTLEFGTWDEVRWVFEPLAYNGFGYSYGSTVRGG